MSDLISRAEAIKMITSLDENVVKHSSDMKILAVERIKRLPVAYDVDKVVRQLNLESVGSSIQVSLGLLRAIEIVKQGGMGKDVE